MLTNCFFEKKNQSRIVLILLLLNLLLWGCTSDKATETITVSVIESTPNSFTSKGGIVGIDVDIATLAMQDAGVEFEIQMERSWSEAYNNTLNGRNHALLSIGYSDARKDLFKLAGPTSKSSYYIFSKATAGIGCDIGVDGAKALSSIAVVRDWLETTTLEDLGFENLIYYNSHQDAVAAFLNGDVVAIASDGKQLLYELREHYTATDFDTCYSYKSTSYYIGFSKDVDDSIVAAVQKSIDTLIENKKTLTIKP